MGNNNGLTTLNLRENVNYQRDETNSLKDRVRNLETMEWPFVNRFDIDAKGDLIVGTANNAYDNLTAGANGTLLTADSTQTTGLKWATIDLITGFAEAAQDAVGSALTDSASVDFTYSDAGNTITAIVIDASITAAKLASDAVTTAKILNANVTTAKIADANVTNAKLADMAQGLIKGRVLASGTGAPVDLSATDASAIIHSTTLAADWSAGAWYISSLGLKAYDAYGLKFYDDGGNLGVFVADGGNVAVGPYGVAAYPLDLRGAGQPSQMHFASANADSGGYVTSAAASNFFFSGGAAWDGTDWLAKTTSAGIIGTTSGRITMYTDASLTAGNTYTATERMRITSTGNVGIGTATTPLSNAWGSTPIVTVAGSLQSVLELAGSRSSGSSSVGIVAFLNEAIGGADDRIGQMDCIRDGADNTGAFRILTWNAGTAGVRMTIKGAGDVGIANTAPKTLFHVGAGADTPGSAGATIYASLAGATSIVARDSTNNVEAKLYANTGTVEVGAHTNHDLLLLTNNTERVRIDTSGQMGIGVTPGAILSIKAGSSTDYAAVGGVLYVSTAQVGNVGAGEDVLASFSVPANTLATNNQSLWFEASGSIANTAAAKTLKARFGTSGTSQIISYAPGNNAAYTWLIKGRVIRTGAATQKAYAIAMRSGGVAAVTDMVTNLDQTLSGAVTIEITGEATNNSDILIESFVVGFDDQNG
jgi:hypothetical protein